MSDRSKGEDLSQELFWIASFPLTTDGPRRVRQKKRTSEKIFTVWPGRAYKTASFWVQGTLNVNTKAKKWRLFVRWKRRRISWNVIHMDGQTYCSYLDCPDLPTSVVFFDAQKRCHNEKSNSVVTGVVSKVMFCRHFWVPWFYCHFLLSFDRFHWIPLTISVLAGAYITSFLLCFKAAAFRVFHPGPQNAPEYRITYNRYATSFDAEIANLVGNEETDNSSKELESSASVRIPDTAKFQDTAVNTEGHEISKQTLVIWGTAVFIHFIFQIVLDTILLADFHFNLLLGTLGTLLTRISISLWAFSFTTMYPLGLFLVTPRYRNQIAGVIRSIRNARLARY